MYEHVHVRPVEGRRGLQMPGTGVTGDLTPDMDAKH